MVDRKTLESPWLWVIGGALVSTWLLGVVHAWGAHSRIGAAAALILPPYGLYMAIEQIAAHPVSFEEPTPSGQDAAPADAEAAYLEQCLQKRVVSDQLSLGENQNKVFCTCSARSLAEGVSEAESDYVAKHGENSPEFMVLRREVSESCLASARSVGSVGAEANR